jgi:hypothetical protein
MKKLIPFLILLPLLFLVGCKATEYHSIYVIPKLDIKGTVETEKKETAKESEEKTEGEIFTGVWLARLVRLPTSSGRGSNLGAIEIIFCPSAKSDFTKCRIGVAWSKKVHPMEQAAP